MADRDDSLREHLRRLLDWQDAHAGFDDAVKDVPEALRATVPEGGAHSPWQLLEHLRICQYDILDFCRNPKYVEVPMESYWPKSAAPPSARAWDESIAAFRRDRDELKKLAADRGLDLFARIPHGTDRRTCGSCSWWPTTTPTTSASSWLYGAAWGTGRRPRTGPGWPSCAGW